MNQHPDPGITPPLKVKSKPLSATSRYNEMYLEQKQKFLKDYCPDFPDEVTAFIFLPEMAIVAHYEAEKRRLAQLKHSTAMTLHEALSVFKKTDGKKYTWNYINNKKIERHEPDIDTSSEDKPAARFSNSILQMGK